MRVWFIEYIFIFLNLVDSILLIFLIWTCVFDRLLILSEWPLVRKGLVHLKTTSYHREIALTIGKYAQ